MYLRLHSSTRVEYRIHNNVHVGVFMKNLSLIFSLGIMTLFGSVGSGFALPTCKGSPVYNTIHTFEFNWTGCVGVAHGIGYIYRGEFKNGHFNGQGIKTYEKHMGTFLGVTSLVEEGVWKKDKFLYAQKTPYAKNLVQPSSLKKAFKKLSKIQRKQLQSKLKD